MSIFKKGLCFSCRSFLITFRFRFFDFKTMPSFDAYAFGMLLALIAMATLALVISVRAVPVVRLISVVRVVVPSAPTRAGRK
jgi:hypothetical protein